MTHSQLQYRHDTQTVAIQTCHAVSCNTDMTHSQLQYRHDTKTVAKQIWNTAICNTDITHRELQYRHDTQSVAIQTWHTVSCNTDMTHSQLQYRHNTQTVAIQTWHTDSSMHKILLQFRQHTGLNATNPPADRILLHKLTSYILFIFLFQHTSCVMLCISSYEHPYVTPPTRCILCYAVHLILWTSLCHTSHRMHLVLCCPSHPMNILMSLLQHDTSCVMLSISSYEHPYVTSPTRSVTNQFHYQWSHCKA